MASIAAKKVAKEVLETVGKGKRPILRHILKKNGYAQNTADSPKQVTETKTYKSIVNPVIEMLEEERLEIIKALKKTRNKAKYRDLTDGLDKTTKNIQLLTGKETERQGVSINFDPEFKK